MQTCPACGRENAEDARFCSACGTALEARIAREERKVVTVLFADLVGFTSRAEQLDPEDVRAILEPYHARLRQELERRGGTVEKFIGDAVMALFGAPSAHEDDPERAVRAALAIRDWTTEEGDLQLRIAVTTGEALVALGARPVEGEGMASGDVVNTAARLQSAAPVDGILVDETTYRATNKAIDYREAEPVTAKGKSAPIPVWEAVEARSRFGVDTALEAKAPLIGRDRELDALVTALSRARAERTPQLVTVVGVPGIGKSRLVYELGQVVEDEPELVGWRQGRSLPYGEGISLWALGEIVKAHLGILETDTPDEAAAKLRRGVVEIGGDDAEWVERHLRPVIGLDADHELRGDHRAEAFSAWRRFFELLAETRPLVLVFEDLHWADEGLLDFIDHLVDWSTGVPILLVCTARPELLARRPGWGGGKPNALTLSLSALGDDDTARLVAALLDRSVLPAETQSALLTRAGGNPLYAEEFVRMMNDRDLAAADSDLPLPESVQGIVAARLDTLSEDEKTLVQDASVVGKVFWLGSVAAIGATEAPAAGDRLHGLDRKEFVRRQPRSSVADETEYAFRHLLVRDVAYGQIPRARRAEKHLAAAAWIEGLGRADDHAEMLAHHYLTALELNAATGAPTADVGGRARAAAEEAGDRAFGLGAYPAAKRFYEAALSLMGEDDPKRPYLLLKHGRLVGALDFGRSKDVLEEAREGLLKAGDVDRAAEADVLIAEHFWLLGQRDIGFVHLDRAEEMVADRPTTYSKAHVVAQISRFRMLAGEADAAIAAGRAALDLIDEVGGRGEVPAIDELEAFVLDNIGSARCDRGDRGGLEDLERSIEIARRINSVESVRAGGNLATMLGHFGDLTRSFEITREALDEAIRFGLSDWRGWLEAEGVFELYWHGEWESAERLADELIQQFAATMFWMETPLLWLRARIRLARGGWDAARADVERGLERGQAGRDPQVLWPAIALAARATSTVDPRRANELIDELLSQWADHGYSLNGSNAWCHDGAVAMHALGRDDLVELHERAPFASPWILAAAAYSAGDFERAAALHADMGTGPEEADCRLRAADALVRAGRRAEADVELQRALAFWRSAGATECVREGEALLAEAG